MCCFNLFYDNGARLNLFIIFDRQCWSFCGLLLSCFILLICCCCCCCSLSFIIVIIIVWFYFSLSFGGLCVCLCARGWGTLHFSFHCFHQTMCAFGCVCVYYSQSVCVLFITFTEYTMRVDREINCVCVCVCCTQWYTIQNAANETNLTRRRAKTKKVARTGGREWERNAYVHREYAVMELVFFLAWKWHTLWHIDNAKHYISKQFN